MEEQDARETSRTQDAESRFATIVKFDIVDSTRLARKISRPDSLELRRGFRAAVESVVKPFDVKIEWEGDGGLILFGYPEVRVDAAEAAVRSGLALIDAVGAVDAVPGVRLELRVGIASGFVTIDLLSGALESMAINKAERLKTTAGPNEVAVADDTRRLVRNFFEYADLGTFQLKGFDEPTRVWRVMRESAVVSRFAAQRMVDSPGTIIGRADTLARLSNAWADALGGHGAAVCLVGDAGMGKSRLARATLDRAEQDGAVVLEIQCTPSTGNSPLLPIGVLLRRTARIGATASELEKEEHARALLARLLGEQDAPEAFEYLAPLFGMQSAPIPIDKTREQVRRRTIESIVAIVRALAAQSPLAVLVRGPPLGGRLDRPGRAEHQPGDRRIARADARDALAAAGDADRFRGGDRQLHDHCRGAAAIGQRRGSGPRRRARRLVVGTHRRDRQPLRRRAAAAGGSHAQHHRPGRRRRRPRRSRTGRAVRFRRSCSSWWSRGSDAGRT